jgi:Ca2+-binding EF-hand superfamily protein
MSSTISSVGGYSSLMTQMMRHNTSKMAQDLFSKIDTSGKGYIEKSDLESAFQQLSSSSSSSGTSTADQIFASLDSNSDGKITQEEMSTGLQKLSDALDSQFQSMRMSEAMGGMGGMNGMPPPPPPQNDAGFTKDELQSQLDQIGSTDSKRSSLLSNIIANFDKADTDGDGKVSFKEAMAYDRSGSSGSTTSTGAGTASTDSTTSTSSATSEAQLMLKILQLMHAYRSDSATTSSVSATA